MAQGAAAPPSTHMSNRWIQTEVKEGSYGFQAGQPNPELIPLQAITDALNRAVLEGDDPLMLQCIARTTRVHRAHRWRTCIESCSHTLARTGLGRSDAKGVPGLPAGRGIAAVRRARAACRA